MKVVISGYYGFDNIGDEAVLKCIIDGLKEKGIEEITVLSNDPDSTTKLYNVAAVNRNSFREVYNAIKSTDVVLSGGGSLIQDKTSSKSLWYYLGVMFIGKLLRKKVFIIGQGIGPIEKKFNRWLTSKILSKLNGITVRDELSKKYLEELNVKNKIIVAADPAVNLKISSDTGLDAVLKKEDLDLKCEYALICTREWGNSELSRVELAKAADFIAQNYGFKIIFLPFYYKKDEEESIKVANYMKMPYKILKSKYSLEEMLSIISHSSLLIGIRLHSLIFACVALTPFIGISYDPKIDGFLNSVGEESAGKIDTFTSDDILKRIKQIMDNKDKYIIERNEYLDKLKLLSQNNFKIFDECFKC